MAEKWIILELQNATIDAMIIHTRDHSFSEQEAQKAWENAPSSSKFHSFLADLHAYDRPYIFTDIDDDDSKIFHIDFVLKVAQLLSLQLEPFMAEVEALEGIESQHRNPVRYADKQCEK